MYESLSIPPEWMHCPLPGDEAWLDAEALTLSGDEISRFDDTRVLETLASLHAVRARADALETHALARLNELRAGARGTAEEAAFELRTTRHTAETRIRRAEHLLRCHPNLLAAMENGVVDGYSASRVLELTAPLPDELAREVDRLLALKLTGGRAVLDPTALRRAARKTVLAVDPDGETQRATVARADRKVELLPGEHSMSTLLADLPAEVAASAYTSIDTAARALRRNGETRTLDQLRADAAPRSVLSYPLWNREGFGGRSLGLMAYLDLKGKGNNSMSGNQWSCPGVRGGALGGPRDTAKAGLPKP